MIRKFPILVLLLAVGVTHVPAQAPSNWVTIPSPPNRITQPNSIGTTVSFLTTDAVWLFSGITKEWTVLPVTNPQPIFQANDYCIIRDGHWIHAYASHTGKVASIKTPGTPTIVSGPSSSSWVTLVTDGLQAWGFGAFRGRWDSIALRAPSPTMVSSRLIGLLHDGDKVYGLNAHYGTFEAVKADKYATLLVVGEAEVGTAHSPGFFRAFSAQHNTWVVQPVPPGASTLQQSEYALAWSGTDVWGFSGLSGTLATYTASAPVSAVNGAPGVAAFVDGGNVVCYGSGRGQFVSRPVGAVSLTLKYHFALIQEPTTLTPFSAITNSFGPTLPGTFSLTTNDEVAFADDGVAQCGYSAILNAWRPAPATFTPTSVSAVRSSIVLGHAGGYSAMSARHGTWEHLNTTLTGNFLAPANGATFVARDGAGEIAHVFDARLNRWATVAGQAPLIIQISRHTVMAHDGVTALGFGQPSGEWYSEPLTAAPTMFDTASSIGTAMHGTLISAYSVQGSFSYTGRYSEFTQAINLGNTLHMHQVAPAGSMLLFCFGNAPARLPMGFLGYLYVAPSQLETMFWPGVVPADGILHMDLPVPNDPMIAGLQIHMQNLVLPPNGPPWLSSSVAPVIF